MRGVFPVLLSCVPLVSGAWAQKPFYEMSPDEMARAVASIRRDDPGLSERVAAVSAGFLGAPYKLHPLGEGPSGRFDRRPLADFKAVDCTTFVEETMALSLASDLKEAERLLQKIRYKGGKISYSSRNHFPSADWIPNNVAAGFIKDITAEIAGPDLKIASKLISKKKWYAEKTARDLEAGLVPARDGKKRLGEFRRLGAHFPDQRTSLPYLPIADLARVLNRIPPGTIANLVREDRPGASVLVSHQVLLVSKGGERYVRHAALSGKVEDVPVLDYFARYARSRWKLLGLNLDAVVERTGNGP